ncbi:hypothetical protein [Inquilinus sp. OTU3971]
MERPRFATRSDLTAAAEVAVAVPPVAMFFPMQRHFIAGLTMGAVKG